jgi:thymidine kinase
METMYVEVITGPMFSGKSKELERILESAAWGKKRILLLKPAIDNRDERNIFNLVKKNEKLSGYENLTTAVISSARDLNKLFASPRFDILAIDEAQFFKSWLLKALKRMMATYCRLDLKIYISGLDTDWRRKGFGIMPALLAQADSVQKFTAVCLHCEGKNGPAIFTQKKPGNSREQVQVGDKDVYEARCRVCHYIPE